ncbi:hypothetical protein EDC01DRAFT_76477 [Geopyxis carbonaria]|nr:hypothetical protein EDC01DRAFT_76477 [Geopyxis carbonaria]
MRCIAKRLLGAIRTCGFLSISTAAVASLWSASVWVLLLRLLGIWILAIAATAMILALRTTCRSRKDTDRCFWRREWILPNKICILSRRK